MAPNAPATNSAKPKASPDRQIKLAGNHQQSNPDDDDGIYRCCAQEAGHGPHCGKMVDEQGKKNENCS
jgi:hypothetical protein